MEGVMSNEWFIAALRWVLVLPVAALLGVVTFYLAYYVVFFYLIAMIPLGGITNGPLRLGITAVVSGLATGGAFVFGGGVTAPSKHKQTMYVLSALLIMISGAMIFVAMVAEQLSTALLYVCVAVGAGFTAYSMGEQIES
jgi:hypothetical protein